MAVQLQNLLYDAIKAEQVAEKARAALVSEVTKALGAVLHEGVVINTRVVRGTPEYLHNVRTVKGNDRGTSIFRIVGAVSVEVEPEYLSGAKWECRAVPVSEKTGKDMSGATHGADSRETVRLRGSVFSMHHVDGNSDTALIARLLAFAAAREDQPT